MADIVRHDTETRDPTRVSGVTAEGARPPSATPPSPTGPAGPHPSAIRREGPFGLLAAVETLAFGLDGHLGRVEGGRLLA